MSVDVDDNTVTVGTDWGGGSHTVDVTLQVPKNSSMHLSITNTGDIEVQNLNGDFEVNNTKGSVTLKNTQDRASRTSWMATSQRHS